MTREEPIKVLVVDDSAFVRRSLTAILEKDNDIKVVATASNGEEAIEMARKHDPDVITMDIEMPRMDGLTALPLILMRDPKRADRLDRAARGLGKLFWMKGLEPRFYGARELERLERA